MANDGSGVLRSTVRSTPPDIAGDKSDAPWYVNDPARWGHIQGAAFGENGPIQWPVFPESAIANARSARIELRGRIAPSGELLDAACSSPDGPAEDFITAVLEVVPRWRFYPGLGYDGLPLDELLLFLVWFGYARDGKPTMNVGPIVPPGALDSERRWLRRKPFEIGYPRGISRLDHDVVVYTRFEIDPRGTVTEITMRRFPETNNAGEDPFVSKVRKITLERNFGATGKAWAACYDVWFRAKKREPKDV